MTHLRRTRRHRDSRGQASLELIGVLPVMLVAAVLVFQVGLWIWAGNSAGEAARSAARARSIAGAPDPVTVARNSLPGSLGDDAIVTVAGERVSVEVKVPELFPLPLAPVRGTAVMPRTDLP